MVEPMENVSTNDKAKTTSEGPNIIGNEEGGPRMAPINFRAFMHQEEDKRPAGNEKLSLDQFTRKVSNKNNLLYTLSIKGKYFPRLLSRSFFYRPDLPPRASLLHYGVRPRPTQRPQALLQER